MASVILVSIAVLPALAMENQVPKTDQAISAEVVLTPASGASLENAVITAANVKDFAPAPESVEAARRFFAEKGFQTGRPSGISFTISAPRSVFESVFGTKVAGAKRKRTQPGEPVEMPLDRLPASLRKAIKAVSFSRPLDFGPTGEFR